MILYIYRVSDNEHFDKQILYCKAWDNCFYGEAQKQDAVFL